jgi:hypothetical protein
VWQVELELVKGAALVHTDPSHLWSVGFDESEGLDWDAVQAECLQ